MSKSLCVILFALFLELPFSVASGGSPVLPPFPTVNDLQVEVYGRALHEILPGVSDDGIAEKVALVRGAVDRSTNEFLAKGREKYGLPAKDTPIEWGLVGGFIGEATPAGRIRFNLVVALEYPDMLLRSVSPHEAAHVLYCELYRCDSVGWAGNTNHDRKWVDIMEGLVGFADNEYPKETVRITMWLTRELLTVAGERRGEWIAVNELDYQDPAFRLHPMLRAFFLMAFPEKRK